MAIAIPDVAALDEIWKNHVYEKESIDKTIIRVLRELAKLNPQRQVHAQELYAGSEYSSPMPAKPDPLSSA